MVLRFGEFAENLREASPGLLDLFGKPSATLISAEGESPLAVTKTAAGFALSAGAGKGQSIAAEDSAFPLRTFKQGDKEITSWVWPGARYVTSLAAQAPKLALDVVPTGEAGEFQVVLKGQALPKAKVVIAVQSGWSKEALVYLYETRKITASGHETTDTDPGIATSKDDYSLESYILGTNHYQIELLANLDKVPEAGALAVVSFPKIAQGTGFPARVFAILP